jgi:SAM-dependent methyltransferase
MTEQRTPTGSRQDMNSSAEYGPNYFLGEKSVHYERSEHWLGFFGGVAEWIVSELEPASVLDAACGLGLLVEALRDRGVEAWGMDRSEFAISRVDDSVRDHCLVASVADPLPRRYDLIVCIEALERLPAEEAEAAIANICASTERLLLSTTPPEFGEGTHLSARPPEEWTEMLVRAGFRREIETDTSPIRPWGGLYRRTEEAPTETIRRYDRSWLELRAEIEELRRSLLAAEERLTKIENGVIEDRPELLSELDRRQEEIMRLRDLLIGKEAELGVALGQVKQLAEHSARLTLILRSVQTKGPALLRRAAHRLRGRG